VGGLSSYKGGFKLLVLKLVPRKLGYELRLPRRQADCHCGGAKRVYRTAAGWGLTMGIRPRSFTTTRYANKIAAITAYRSGPRTSDFTSQ
jgi:hypothetical protein